ncbi:hypothetical protein [Shewanella fidelis]|uniref:Rubredoxin-like domain-containing protein n=1 Tax=Shewanella fidelis TaxID=173509 RepID=A0AAW8NNX7_9GAMM|nr:hypothetical protein [Shewanella fidelis]MDR8523856.1 hypothetical protein [Shewanella fidelis]MDW4810404.1 hypothetical protein [Shewanella fidelis]MDW4823709.1 hypothetical protein [Shewanella fidelis]
MIFQCTECGYEQRNEEFNLCPVCVASEKAELEASAAEAHLHIDAVNEAIRNFHKKHIAVNAESPIELSAEVRALLDLMMNWEADQCPF